jgi:hypothetical protein
MSNYFNNIKQALNDLEYTEPVVVVIHACGSGK